MKIARIEREGRIYLARIEGEKAVLLTEESTHPAADALRESIAAGSDLNAEGFAVDLESVRLLAPVANPGKFLAIGQNYLDHARESGAEEPQAPIIFTKAVTSIIGPEEFISFQKDQTSEADYEGELALIIGKRSRRINPEDVEGSIFGFTVCNDVSARDAQFADGQWVRGKSFDTFAPLGPWIVTGDSIQNIQSLAIRTWVNGKLLQNGNTSDMIFSVVSLVSYISQFMTLEPGDVIATGTPVGVGFARNPPVFLDDGDMVDVEVEGIGHLRNAVRSVSSSS